jgi:DNA-binding CsgD family transcriptional regulator
MATGQRTPLIKDGFKCPICGTWAAAGGCQEPRKCLDALAALEKVSTRETVEGLANQSRSQARILEAGFDALSLLHIGLVLCSTGKVVGVNPVAEGILASRDGLEMTPDGILRTTQEGKQPLTQTMRRVVGHIRAGRFASHDTVLAVERGGRRRPLTVIIRASHVAGKDAGGSKGTVLIMILDSALPVRTIESELRQLYGFSSTEARLANLLMEGKALETCCQELDIQRSTGCTHLRRLFKKTRVHRQSELVGLLLKSIGLACLGDPNMKPESSESVPFEGQRRVRAGLSAL